MSKAALPSDWSKGLENYAHVLGGIGAMGKVKSKSKLVSFTAVVTTNQGFDMESHLTPQQNSRNMSQ